MYKGTAIIFLLMGFQLIAGAQLKTENVVLITIDGLRWQELFMGADPDIIKSKRFVADEASASAEFWNSDYQLRRQKLFPFLWGTIAPKGQVYGNRNFGNRVSVTNRYLFSYPGYNELLTGKPDKRIRNNARRANPNETILEFASRRSEYKDKVAAFASWDVFHYIINSSSSGVYVNAGNDTAKSRLTPREKYINHLQRNSPSPWKATRYDEFTHNYAKEYIRKNAPKLLLIAYGETDEFAHQGKYDEYLKAARRTDAYIKEIWQQIQSDDNYRNNTTLIITTDHGRGSGKRSWKGHGMNTIGSNHTWFIIIGPDTKPLGEIKVRSHHYTNQIARTIAAFLKLDYPADTNQGSVLLSAFAK